MTLIGSLILAASATLTVIQLVMSLRLIMVLRRPPVSLLTDAECPPVIAVLCLRGTDPFLTQTLQRLFTQDYPNYRVRVVIDSTGDPARNLVEDVIREMDVDHVDVQILDHRDDHCSAKMSSLLLATESLPEDCAYVATFDGDALLHPSCLRELISSQVRQNADVATGNRWFAPETRSIGALGRFQWNLGCVPLMNAMKLPWGGCLSMSRDVISNAAVRDLYGGAFAEDILLGSLLKQNGQSLVFVPEATIVNREDLSAGGLLNFLTRQMLCVRLHHHQWKRILGFGIALGLMIGVVCPLGLLIPGLRVWCAAGLSIMVLGIGLSAAFQGRALRKVLARRDEHLIKFTPRVVLAMLSVMPISQLIILRANLQALAAHQTTWRGLTYRFGRSPIVTLIHEVPVRRLDEDPTTLGRRTAAEHPSLP